MEKEIPISVEKILQKEQLAEKRLIRKIYIIVTGMILLLTTIIIVEFKEYSHNYSEYKIGLNELGPKDLVWAGIMGTSPRYFDSNEKHGLGYKEFETREIRKALNAAGINLIYRYMSPNRLEFEFERKHAICFYDKQWNNPVEYFKRKRHSILSIPRYYSGQGLKKIFFRKGERHRFGKHLDSNGNIKLESLINDTSLKTELIRKVEYDGPYANVTYGKRQLDGTYYDYVKPKYQKNIDLVILHTNDQIIQMLKWKRFDYQFLDTLESDDFPWMDGGEKGIETLIYDVKSVTSVDDPNFIFHSVACGNHPLTKFAMPIINEVIKSIRVNKVNYDRSRANETKLNSLNVRPNYNYFLGSPYFFSHSVFQADKWYLRQFAYLKISPWTMFNEKEKTPPLEIKKNLESIAKVAFSPLEGPQWNLIERKNSLGEKSLVIINDVDIKDKQEEYIIVNSFLDENYNLEEKIIIDRKINFTDLSFSKRKSFDKIIIFARGIKDHEFPLLKPYFDSTTLKGITLIETSPHQNKLFLEYIPKQIEQLRLYDIPLMGLSFSHGIKKLKILKELKIHATTKLILPLRLELKEMMAAIHSLPNTLEIFSIIEREKVYMTDFPLKAAEIFTKKNFSNLKQFTLLNFYLDDRTTKIIFNGLPLTLESLIIGQPLDNINTTGGISSILLEEFLHKRKNLNVLKRLHLHQMFFSLRKENKIILPESLEDFLLSKIWGLNDGNFHRIILPPQLKFKQLSVTHCDLNDSSFLPLLSHLDLKVKKLELNNNKLTGYSFFQLTQMHPFKNTPIEIDNFSIHSNPVNDFGIYALSALPWKIKNVNLSNLKMSDLSSDYLASNKNWYLASLDLSDNFLNARSINKILQRFGKNLQEITLNNLLSIDVKNISEMISPKLESLSLAANMLNDEEISSLIKKLPKTLNVLNISGSQMTAKSALLIAKNKPKLSQFSFDFKFGEEDESLSYLFKNLSPFLSSLYNYMHISQENAILLSKHMPPYLSHLLIDDFEKEESKILFSSLPPSLKHLYIKGNIKSKGDSLRPLLLHFPSKLSKIHLNNNFSQKEIVDFIQNLKLPNLMIQPLGSILWYSPELIKDQTRYLFLGNGPQRPEYFKNINLPSTTIFYGNLASDLPSGFLNSLNKSQLGDLRFFSISNCKNFSNQEIFNFLKKLPAYLLSLRLSMTNLKENDVDTYINLLPKNLRSLTIIENNFGEEGLKKFRAYKRKREEETGIPFLLLEENLL